MDKITLITGASTGIGKALAEEFASNGHNLLLVARTQRKLDALKTELENKYMVNVYVYAADLCQEDACEQVISYVENKQLELEYLINNAGMGDAGLYVDSDWEKLALFLIREGFMAWWGYLALKHTDTVNSAKWYGKAATAVLYAVMMVLIFFGNIPDIAANILMILCAAVMLLSLVLYGRFYRSILRPVLPKQEYKQEKDNILKIFLAVLWAAIFLFFLFHWKRISADEIVRDMPQSRRLAAVVMLALFTLRGLSIVILYTGILYAVDGMLFPLPVAVLLNLCGSAIMVSLPYWISRKTAVALAQEYGGRVHVVDNHRISVSQRQSALEAKYLAGQGKSAEEITEYLAADGLNAHIYLAVNTLEYLKKSGRVTAAGAAVATILNLKPVLQIQGGKLDAWRKARGMNAAMKAMIEGLRQDQADLFVGQEVTIRGAYSGDPENGELWREELQKAFPEFHIEIDPLPLSIACHSGDGALGVGIMKNIFKSYTEEK